MIVCKQCDVVVSIDDQVYEAKLKSHQLWHHPSDQDVADAEMYIINLMHVIKTHSLLGNDEYAALIAADLVEVTMRYRKYMELKL